MNKKWIFLRPEFAADVTATAKRVGLKMYEVEALCGVSFAGSMMRDDWLPTMRNYLHICYMLELNPRDYIDEQ